MPGTRADVVVTLTLLVTLIAPAVAFMSTRLARTGRHAAHRRVQLTLLAVCWTAVLALEVRIRIGGGSGSLVAQAAPAWLSTAKTLLLLHIGGAVLTYIAWTVLAVMSSRRFTRTLPGAFSRAHRRAGWAVIAGLTFTALSAAGMYLLAFVL